MIRDYLFDFTPDDITKGVEKYRSTRAENQSDLYHPQGAVRHRAQMLNASLNETIVTLTSNPPEQIIEALRNVAETVVQLNSHRVDKAEAGERLFKQFPQSPSLAMFLRDRPGTHDVGEYIMSLHRFWELRQYQREMRSR